MSALPKTELSNVTRSNNGPSAESTCAVNAMFLRFLPAVEDHAAIQFRHLPPVEREERMAEAKAAAFVNVHRALHKGNGHRLKASMVAHYAVLHVKDGRHVGGTTDGKCDVLSRKAQQRGGFRVVSLPWDSEWAYNGMTDATSPVWREVLADDKRTPIPDQAAFRIDLSRFLGQQSDRTRQVLGMLAAGHQQTEVADVLGVTPPAICQRRKRAAREWAVMQGET